MPKMAREKDPEKNELSKEHTGKCMRYGEWMQSMKSRNLWNQNQAIKIEEKKKRRSVVWQRDDYSLYRNPERQVRR